MPSGVYDKSRRKKTSPGSGRTKESYIGKEAETKKKMAKAAAAQTPENRQTASIKGNIGIRVRRIEGETQAYIKQALMTIDPTDPNSKKSFLMNFVDLFLHEAKADPQGKAGMLLAGAMFNDQLLAKLDEASTRAMKQDLDFARYRIRSTLFDKQKEVYDDNENEEILIICSRRAGKTELNARLLLKACIDDNTPCLYINLTFTNAITQEFGLCHDLAIEYGIDITNSSSNDGCIEFSNGSFITFRGNATSAEAEKHRGNKYKVIIIDEVGHQRNLKYLIEDVLSPLQKDFYKHTMIYTGTPPRVPHHYSEYLWNRNGVKRYTWTMKDNPFIPNAEEEIKKEAEKRGMGVDDSYIKREYLGVMGAYDTESQVYKGYQVYTLFPQTNFTPTDIFIGVDWGGAANNAIAVLMADRYSKKGYVEFEFKQNNMCTSDICHKIIELRAEAIKLAKRMNADFEEKACIVIPDTNEPNTIFELQKIYNVPNVQKPFKHDLMWGVHQLQELVRTGIICIKQGGLIEDEFQQILFKRDEDTGVILNEIDDDLYHGDIEAALRYASRHFCELILSRTQTRPVAPEINRFKAEHLQADYEVRTDEGVTWD